jgi:hypothetical protein
MKKTKYIMSGGTAFAEQEDLQKLSDYAKKGWLLDRFAFLGYTLKKGEPQDLQYSLDFQENAVNIFCFLKMLDGSTFVQRGMPCIFSAHLREQNLSIPI